MQCSESPVAMLVSLLVSLLLLLPELLATMLAVVTHAISSHHAHCWTTHPKPRGTLQEHAGELPKFVGSGIGLYTVNLCIHMAERLQPSAETDTITRIRIMA